MTPEEIQEEIAQLKWELQKSDHYTLKWVEGWLTDEEYLPIKAQREAQRARIRELQKN